MELERAGERRRRLLGSLADLIGNAVFRGDQLVGGALRFRAASFQACLDHPQWRSLEVLDLQWRSSKALALGAFINGLPALQELKGLWRQMLPEVPCPRVTRLGAMGVPVKDLARLFPAVRSLELQNPCESPEAFWSDRFVQRLESLRLTAAHGAAELWWSKDVLTAVRPGFLDQKAEVAWIAAGPLLRRFEFGEDTHPSEFGWYEAGLLVDVARRRGAVELPVIAPQAERSSWCENCGEMLPWLC